jgi:ABC-type multidrug transport system fused ATPase/permease subunit
MQAAFQRARSYGGGTRIWVILFGILSAVFPPVLIVILGLAVQLLLNPRSSNQPSDPILSWLLNLPALRVVSTESERLRVLAVLAVIAVILSASLGICWTLLRRAARAAARHAAAGLKSDIHAQAFRLGCNDVLGSAGSWPEEIFTSRVEIVRQGLSAWWRSIPHAIVLAALLLTLAFVVHLSLAMLGLLLALMVWRIDDWLRDWSGHQARLWSERAQLTDERLVETLNLAPLVTNYAMADPPNESFADLLRQQQNAGYRADSHEAARSPWFWMFVLWSVIFFVLVVAISSTASFAGTVMLATALIGAAFPVRRLWRLRNQLPTYEMAARDISAYLERTTTIAAAADSKPLPPLQREVRLENVTLEDREGHMVLMDVSLSIPFGSRVAVLATDEHTPHGLWGLFVRFYDPAAGRVLFDDLDIRLASVADVRRQSALVLNDALLFTGTVSENISCSRPEVTVDEIHDAAKDAHAIDFVYQLPDGFDTIVGEQGMKLESSMAFRIALARALIREPSLLIVEEPQLPAESPDLAVLDTTIAAAAQGRTMIVLATRLSTLRNADLIILLHEGHLVAIGKHAELLQTSELYRHLNYIRFHPFPHVV